jgi:hypothetical protein
MKTGKLKKTKFEYMALLYSVWKAVDYYSKLMQVIAGHDPAKTPATLYEENGVTHVTLRFECVENTNRKMKEWEVKETINEFLRINLLPAQNILKPYRNGTTSFDIVECIYIDNVSINNSTMFIDVVYIDNPMAYKYVRNRDNLHI